MNLSIATCSTPSTTLATNTTNTCMLVPATNQIPLTSLLSNARAQGASVNIHASVTNTSGQVILGSGVNSACASTTTQETNPFILKKRTNLMKICQACRKGYDGNNDTLGLVVARLERRMISNMSTGIQFLGKASNSHYHCHMNCLKAVEQSFHGRSLHIPDSTKAELTQYQKLYLSTCIQVPLNMLL